MNNWVNFQQLQYFKSIVDHGSIAKASKELRVSPPALSMQLKSLEEKLGKKLFERKNKKLIITDFGNRIYSYSNKVNDLHDDILEFINTGGHEEIQQIKIGINDSLPKSISLSLIENLRSSHDELGVVLEEHNNEELIAKLLSNKLDVAFCNIPISDSGGELICKQFGKSHVSLYGSPVYKSLIEKFPHSIIDAPMILPSLHSDLRHSVDYWFVKNKITYRNIIEVQDSSVKKIFACEGFGLVPLPDFATKSYIESKQLLKIGQLKGVTEKYYWISKKKRYQNKPLIQELIKVLSSGFTS